MDFPEDIYSTRILEVVATMPELGLLENHPDRDNMHGAYGSATRHSKLCGSKVKVDLLVDAGGKISHYGHEVEACLLGQTSSAIMARNAIGLTRSDIFDVQSQMWAMLKEEGAAPTGIWTDLEVLYPVKDYKPRHTSMLLVFDAVLEAMDEAARAQIRKPSNESEVATTQ